MQEPKTGFIAVVGLSEDDPVWNVLAATALRQRETLEGIEVKPAAPRRRSASAQIQLLKDLYSRRMLGLCIEPADPEELVAPLEELRSKGVVVVTLLRPVPAKLPFFHSGADELAVGRALADAIDQVLDGKGIIAVVDDEGRHDQRTNRYLGFHGRIGAYPGIRVLRELDCNGIPQVARRIMSEYMQRYPRLEGWVATHDWPIRGLPSKERLLPEGCRLVTFGPIPEYWPRIADGSCPTMVGVNYSLVAEYAIRMCRAAIKGEPSSMGTYLSPPIVVTQENLNEFKATWMRWAERPPGASIGATRLPDHGGP